MYQKSSTLITNYTRTSLTQLLNKTGDWGQFVQLKLCLAVTCVSRIFQYIITDIKYLYYIKSISDEISAEYVLNIRELRILIKKKNNSYSESSIRIKPARFVSVEGDYFFQVEKVVTQ